MVSHSLLIFSALDMTLGLIENTHNITHIVLNRKYTEGVEITMYTNTKMITNLSHRGINYKEMAHKSPVTSIQWLSEWLQVTM